MSAILDSILTKLSANGIKLWCNNNQLNYSAPKGALNADLKKIIIENKKELIEKILFSKLENNKSLSVILAADREKPLPLSFAQERLWFLDHYEEQNSAYHLPGLIDLQGTLNTAALQQTFHTIIERHEALRTNFIEQEGHVTQIIHNDFKFEIEKYNLGYTQDEEFEKAINRAIQSELNKPFNLETDQLFRVSLYKINSNEHYIFINTL